MKYLLLLLLIPSLAFATNNPKHQPVKISQGQVSVNKNDNKNINVSKAIADVKNNLKLTNKLYGGDSKSSATLLQGDTNSFSGGNSFNSSPEMNFAPIVASEKTIGDTTVSLPTISGGITYGRDGYTREDNWGAGFTFASPLSWFTGQDAKDLEEARKIQKINKGYDKTIHELTVVKLRGEISEMCVSDLHPTVLIKADPMLAEFCAAYTHNKNAHIDKHDAECDEDQASPHAECHKD